VPSNLVGDEQSILRSSVVRLLGERSDANAIRSAMASGVADASLWRSVVQAELVGVGIPEENGGSAGSGSEVGLVLYEMGRTLAPIPYLETVGLAIPLLKQAATSVELSELLSLVASGLALSIALVEPGGGWDPELTQTFYRSHDDGYRVTGTKILVPRGLDAKAFVVVGRREGTSGTEGLSCLWVDAAAEGVSVSPMVPMDPTWPQAQIVLIDAPARVLGDHDRMAERITTGLGLSAAFLSAYMAGAARRCLEMAVSYSRERHQFGRPIGSFQAIKHRCADMLFDAEACRAISAFAVSANPLDEQQVRLASSIAKAWCSQAFYRCAAANLQIHGGLGFTWEHDCHLYYRRAKASAQFLGGAAFHHTRLANALVIGSERWKAQFHEFRPVQSSSQTTIGGDL
jgi:alkylation response protein AidB-like acyl-CoA dehydrogenase